MKEIHHRLMRDFGEICWSKSNQLTGRIYSSACPPPLRQMGSAVGAGPPTENPPLFGLSNRPQGTAEASRGDVLTCPSLPGAGEAPGQDAAALGAAVGRGACPARPALATPFWTCESSSPFAVIFTSPGRGSIL